MFSVRVDLKGAAHDFLSPPAHFGGITWLIEGAMHIFRYMVMS